MVLFSSMALLGLSFAFSTGAAAAAELRLVGIGLDAASEWAFVMSVGLVFPTGALVFYGLLYRERLVPTWISLWGLAAAALLLVGTALDLLGPLSFLPAEAKGIVLPLPIAVNEMVLAVWLIARGFNEAVEPDEHVAG